MKTADAQLRKMYNEAMAKVEREYITFKAIGVLLGVSSDALLKRAKGRGFETFVGDYPGQGANVAMIRRDEAQKFVYEIINPKSTSDNSLA